MKKMMLILMLVGFGAYSQAQTKNCTCKKKVTRATVKKTPPVTQVAKLTTVRYTPRIIEPCTQYRKNNIVVTQCPGVFYDNSDIDRLYEFRSEGTFGGYYPVPLKDNYINGTTAPQHNVIDNYKGVAPAGGNACNDDCTSR